MDTKAKREYVKRFYREMVRDGHMNMTEGEIVEIVHSLNAAQLASEVKECKEIEAL